MGSIGFEELLIVGVVAIILFGKDLPSVARKVGGWYMKAKRQISDIREEIQRQIPPIEDDDLLNPAPPREAPPGVFDPSKPRTPAGNGSQAGGASPADAATSAKPPESGSKPPGYPPPGGAGGDPPASSGKGA